MSEKLYNRLLKPSVRGKRGLCLSHFNVTTDYDGGEHKTNNYIKRVVTVASTLLSRTINVIF